MLVALPRLRSFALRENEADAVHLLRTVGASLVGTVEAAAPRPDLVEVLRSEPELERRLENAHDYGDGVVLRHGYLFERFEPAPGRLGLRAWPFRYGETGRRAFVWQPEAGVRQHDNRTATFDGPGSPPTGSAESDDGWRAARR